MEKQILVSCRPKEQVHINWRETSVYFVSYSFSAALSATHDMHQDPSKSRLNVCPVERGWFQSADHGVDVCSQCEDDATTAAGVEE